MPNTPKQTTLVTSVNKRPHQKEKEPKDSVNPLSKTRKEAKISNSSCANENSTSKANQASSKMAKRLEPIKDLLALLPKPLSQQTSEFATSLFSKAIEVRHYDKRETYYKANPDIDPNSIGFKYKLTCKLEYEDHPIFITQAALAAKIMEETKENL